MKEWTMAALRERCVVDQDSGCWVFPEGRGHGHLYFGPLKGRVNLSQAIGWLIEGKKPAKGVHYWPTCGVFRCCNPDHRRRGNRSDYMRVAIPHRSTEQRLQIVRTKAAASRISEQTCAAIRISDEPLKVLSERYGISMSHASRIRLGQLRKPLAGGASVFAWRPGA